MASSIASSAGIFNEILSRLDGNEYFEVIKDHLNDIPKDFDEIRHSESAERFLQWVRMEGNLKDITVDVPDRILPEGYEGRLHDVRVFVKHGPDDSVYDNNKNIRERIARGNSFLEITTKQPRTFCVLQAMKKFTGGLGDDDDRESGDTMIWQKYFTKPIEETKLVIATNKANGEAAHLSCVNIDGTNIWCGGSKNVHLLFRNQGDINKYSGSRYKIASEVCHTVMDVLDQMSLKDQQRLMDFLVESRYTAVFEILAPEHQHVVNLSYLKKPALKFITWTKCELDSSEKLHHLNVVPPNVGIEIAKCLKLDPVTYEEVKMKDLGEYIHQIRGGFDTEGKVLYFLDKDNQVIGLLKKKTTWYIMCRAIREKVKMAVHQSTQNPGRYSLSKSLTQVERRVRDIQKWLQLDDETTQAWKELGVACVKWALHEVDGGRLSQPEVQDLFPVYWERFLRETSLTDRINVKEEMESFGTLDKDVDTDLSGACRTET